MICRTCLDDPCTCREGSPTKIRSTEHYLPPGITKEEFGLSLYEAVKICGGILQLQDMRKKTVGRALVDLETRERIMLQQLAAITPKLPVSDQEALLERYPRLFT